MQSSRKYFYALILAVFGLSLVPDAFGQTPVTAPTPPDDVGQTRTFEVRLPVTVTEKKDKLVSGLNRNDFIVLEMA